jgi:hypothetical protein
LNNFIGLGISGNGSETLVFSQYNALFYPCPDTEKGFSTEELSSYRMPMLILIIIS